MKLLKSLFKLLLFVPLIATTLIFTGCPVGTLDAPENVSATDGTHQNFVLISWDEVKGDAFNPTKVDADYYRVYRSNETWIGFNMFFQISPDITGTSFLDGNVTQDAMYYYKVKAYTDDGKSSDYSEYDEGWAGTGGIVCQAPNGVSATDGDSADSVTVSWNSVSDALSYNVLRSDSASGSYSEIADSVTGTSYEDDSVETGIIFYYKVSAVCADGESALSSSDSGFAGCLPIDPPVASASNGQDEQITVSWNAVPGATGYNVYASSGSCDDFSAVLIGLNIPGTSLVDTAAAPGEIKSYKVTAMNECMEESDESECAEGYAGIMPPSCPDFAVENFVSSVAISWSATDNAVSYNVYKNSALVVNTTELSYTDGDIDYPDCATYIITAVNAEDEESSSCAGVSGCPLQQPGIDCPSDVAASTGQIEEITITWSSVAEADSYNIYRDGVLIDDTTGTSYVDSGVAGTKTYVVNSVGGGIESDGCGSVEGSAIICRTPEEVYEFFMYLVNDLLDKVDAADYVFPMTFYGSYSGNVVVTKDLILPPPPPPKLLIVLDFNDYTDEMPIEGNFIINNSINIYLNTNMGGLIEDGFGMTGTAEVSGDTELYVTTAIDMKAMPNNHASVLGGEITFASPCVDEPVTMELIMPVPDVPQNVSATDGVGDMVTVTWDEVPLGDNLTVAYNVYRSTAIAGSYAQIASNQSGLSYDDSDVVGGTVYFYKVSTYNWYENESELSDADEGSIGVVSDQDGDGYTVEQGDCDDTDSAINPGADEVCDNVDNNCAGGVDEGLSRATTCGIGPCASTGTETCDAGNWTGDTCVEGPASDEVCDNVDNDCDGTTDEDLSQDTECGVGACASNGTETCDAGNWVNNTCVPGTASDEVCDDIDNDCDGTTDEDLSQDTECGVGACASNGTETCDAGNWVNNTCVPGTASDEICDNVDNDCDGSIDEDLSQATECGVGACASNGTETCDAGNWGNDTCVPGPASDEVCDNIDNDCDGSADEDLSRGTDCGTGACASNGTEVCDAGSWVVNVQCVEGTPSEEVCDTIDNDCDGTADEGLGCEDSDGDGFTPEQGDCNDNDNTIYPGATETCDNVDNDCDNDTDEGLSRDTTCGIGPCASTGTETCEAGNWVGDTCVPGPASDEICDNIDNDCDGSTDEDLSQNTECGVGACASNGTETCDAGNWVVEEACVPGTASEEVCDNIDNDCDGSADEDLSRGTECGIGACASTGNEVCDAGSWVVNVQCVEGTPSEEVCDTVDNDCDGTADEGLGCEDSDGDGFTPEQGDCNDNDNTIYPGATETCDNVDNDCDNDTDEGLSRDTVCGIGPCASTGTEICEAGNWVGDTCVPGPASDEVCDNIDNDCDGATDENLSQGTECGVGACASNGTDVCDAGNWVVNEACVPGTASDEICDNIDNDCDGTTDEDLSQATECGIGACASTGSEVCDAGSWVIDVQCVEGTPSTEVCDAIDNDCDGTADEGLGCEDNDGDGFTPEQGDCNDADNTIYPGATELCDNVDNDCDNDTDEGLSQDTTCGIGPCASTGTETCDAGNWVNDTCVPGPASDEICDNIDNDCDGATDEDLSQDTTCGVGACASNGTETCDAGSWVNDTCVPGTASDEVCDNVDNDCDGNTDEDLSQNTECGVGACASNGTETCDAGNWVGDTCVPGTVSDEVCDNIDNDCDGSTDEDLSQNTACGVGECASTGTETCEAGAWVNDTCVEGTPSDEVCDNADNDCDGSTDEDLSQNTTCGVGECASTGTDVCDAGSWVVGDECVPGAPVDEDNAALCGNGIDEDCDGADFDCGDLDVDEDGVTVNEGDCNDEDSTIYPGAPEICNDGIDQDCSGEDCIIPECPAVVDASDNIFDQIDITWSASENATFYNIYRDGEFLDSVPATELSYTDYVMGPFSANYSVTAANGDGECDSPNSDDGIVMVCRSPEEVYDIFMYLVNDLLSKVDEQNYVFPMTFYGAYSGRVVITKDLLLPPQYIPPKLYIALAFEDYADAMPIEGLYIVNNTLDIYLTTLMGGLVEEGYGLVGTASITGDSQLDVTTAIDMKAMPNNHAGVLGGEITIDSPLPGCFEELPLTMELLMPEPDAPENIAAEIDPEKAVVVSWDEVPLEDNMELSYNVYRSEASDGVYTQIGSGISVLTYTDGTTDPETTYYYKVSTYNWYENESDLSDYVAITTPEGGMDISDFYMNVFAPIMNYAKYCKFYDGVPISNRLPGVDMWFWGNTSGMPETTDVDPAGYDVYRGLTDPDSINPWVVTEECMADPLCPWGADDLIYYPFKPCDGQTANGEPSIPPFVHPDNTMHWTIILQPWGLGLNIWEYTNYNDGRDLGDGPIDFIANGEPYGEVTTDGNGTQTGPLTITGDHETIYDVSYILIGKNIMPPPVEVYNIAMHPVYSETPGVGLGIDPDSQEFIDMVQAMLDAGELDDYFDSIATVFPTKPETISLEHLSYAELTYNGETKKFLYKERVEPCD